MNKHDEALVRRVAERDTDQAEAVIPGNELNTPVSSRCLSLPEVTVALLHGDPTRRHVIWRCIECNHVHSWRWMTWDVPYGEIMAMDCDHCGHRQRMSFPADPSPDRGARWAGEVDQWLQSKPTAPAAKPLIQDGQRLAVVAAMIAERLMDRNWVQLRMDSSEHATDLIEMAAALREFGA